MQINRDDLICGLRPSILKKLFAREIFDTLTAMADLGLDEPQVSRALVALEDDGWIFYKGCKSHVDCWETTEKAQRLCATRLIKRFPIREGRRIVKDAVAEARLINGDTASSCRITEIILFGSILTGGEDGDAGDIDLIVGVQRRRLDKEEMEQITAAEEAAMPDTLSFFQRIHRVEYQMLRRIKKISNKIALHRRSDLEALGAPHRTIYAYSIDRERELPVDTAIKVLEKPEPQEEESTPERSQLPANSFRFEWPAAPNAPVELERVEIEQLRRAQHMWVKSAALSDIARSTGIPKKAVQAYLAGRPSLPAKLTPHFKPDLKAMIDQVLPNDRRYLISSHLYVRPGQNPLVETSLREPDTYLELADIRRFSPSSQIFHGRCDLLPLIEPANEFAWFWYQKMRRNLKGIGLDLFASHFPHDVASSAFGDRAIDFRPFSKPMLSLLEKLLPVPRPRYSEYDHSLEIRLGGSVSIIHRVGSGWQSDSATRRIKKALAPELWGMVRIFNEQHREALGNGGICTLFVTGGQLDLREDAV